MPNGENAARRKARELVEEIENEHGHVGEETLRQIDDPTIRAKLTNALKAKDGMIGSTVITYQTSHSLAHCTLHAPGDLLHAIEVILTSHRRTVNRYNWRKRLTLGLLYCMCQVLGF